MLMSRHQRLLTYTLLYAFSLLVLITAVVRAVIWRESDARRLALSDWTVPPPEPRIQPEELPRYTHRLHRARDD